MSRTILTAALAALWLIAFDTVPASVSNTPALSGSAHAGNTVKPSKSNTSDRSTTVKSSKSNTSDRKGGSNKTGNQPFGIPGGRGY